MSSKVLSATVALLLTAIVPVFAQFTTIPKCNVVPVYLENGLNSAVSQPGETFHARCCEADCGGFPTNTRFMGQVKCVTRRTDKVPGQLIVAFTQAVLPDKTVVNINGAATSFAGYHVTMDSNGRRIATEEGRNPDNRFIGYCLNSVVIGTVVVGCIRGGAVSPTSEWIESLKLGQKTPPANVDLPPKTAFGIVLLDDVCLLAATNEAPDAQEAPAGTGPERERYRTILPPATPYASSNRVLMLPFRAVMNGTAVAFTYDPEAKSVTMNWDSTIARHAIGTNVLKVNDTVYTLRTSSVLSAESVLFVSRDMIELLTGRTAVWNQDTGVLNLD